MADKIALALSGSSDTALGPDMRAVFPPALVFAARAAPPL